ncbi:MAG: carboxypeptidase-like regulatory domain-containing protein [Fluviicola sp.]|nr:carboxypeptidase-like regulatory domain-containing protein [Fluviicola sp.]
MKTQKITIPSPCTIGWKNMQDTANGKFCQSCNKIIPDFSRLPDFQIRSIIEQTDGDVCGRISLSQLNRIRVGSSSVSHSNTEENNSFLKVAVLTGVMLSSISLSAATPKQSPFLSLPSIDVSTIVPETNSLEGDIEISGVVVDQLNKEPIVFANVKLIVDGYTYGATTDLDGKFKLMLPESLLDKVVSLSIQAIDYETTTVNVKLSKNRVYKEIEMKLDENVMIEGIIIREDD